MLVAFLICKLPPQRDAGCNLHVGFAFCLQNGNPNEISTLDLSSTPNGDLRFASRTCALLPKRNGTFMNLQCASKIGSKMRFASWNFFFHVAVAPAWVQFNSTQFIVRGLMHVYVHTCATAYAPVPELLGPGSANLMCYTEGVLGCGGGGALVCVRAMCWG